MSSPIAKQLASWLKEADKADGLLELSIAGLVFMVEVVEALGRCRLEGFRLLYRDLRIVVFLVGKMA